ncbi:MAG TPA: K(+)-transporting ATPase subunit F [bacterium]|jgi:K+-transporting ATPase KdpF subunit
MSAGGYDMANILLGLLAAGLMIYLLYSLIHPEKF